MATLTIAMGACLFLIGLGGYFGTGAQAFTALIPTFFGAIFIVLGLVAKKESRRKHAVHAALVLALVGLLGASRGLIGLSKLLSGAQVERPVAVALQSLMAFLCLMYIAIGIRSFVAARQARSAGTLAP